MTFRTLNSVVIMQSVAAGFAESVTTENKKPGNVEFIVKLALAMGTKHLTTIIMI